MRKEQQMQVCWVTEDLPVWMTPAEADEFKKMSQERKDAFVAALLTKNYELAEAVLKG